MIAPVEKVVGCVKETTPLVVRDESPRKVRLVAVLAVEK